jgi:hypothetical protein
MSKYIFAAVVAVAATLQGCKSNDDSDPDATNTPTKKALGTKEKALQTSQQGAHQKVDMRAQFKTAPGANQCRPDEAPQTAQQSANQNGAMRTQVQKGSGASQNGAMGTQVQKAPGACKNGVCPVDTALHTSRQGPNQVIRPEDNIILMSLTKQISQIVMP